MKIASNSRAACRSRSGGIVIAGLQVVVGAPRQRARASNAPAEPFADRGQDLTASAVDFLADAVAGDDREPHLSALVHMRAHRTCDVMLSSAIAIPIPPLTQSVASPRRALRRCISWRSVTTMRAPVQPIGWPSAMAPPLTLSLSRRNRHVAQHREHLRARTPRSVPRDRSRRASSPVRCEQLPHRRHRTDAHDPRIDAGARPADDPRRAAAGRAPSRCDRARSSTSAAPPSVMPDDVPGGDDARRALRRSEDAAAACAAPRSWCPARGCSSASIDGALPFASVTVTGAISSSKRPSAIARVGAAAGVSSAYASDCLARDAVLPREHFRRLAHDHAAAEHVKPSRYIASTSVKLPMLWPHRASSASTRYGMRLIDSMPPATHDVAIRRA